LGIIPNFNDTSVTWDTDTIPMKGRGTLNTQEALVEVYLTANELQSMVSKLSCSTKILDAEYKPACLDKVIKMCDNLSQEQQQQLLLHMLQKYEHLIDGT
jgi:hypothetical protein